ncbi:Uncharacterized short protein YbdD, DUF466 family [Seinonella peptonophila]|uniref:Uncharacterized short protein YbdD, DUF466 family n=1 Tax=Seinonella peptonophila TaxID=112248 RepID=A0A1M4WN83_9BACL|nr:YbdD/YjiX family protein [Seinonella peptonophila]SHE82696.1 Uncharacterized short protein YbdD, DUF466 family [Seinonella peptonophila]
MSWLKPFVAVADYLNAIAGVPNYQQYVDHMEKYHPNEKILSEKEFHRQAIDERYGGGTIRRCC